MNVKSWKKSKIIVILGPTASGKSELAVKIAKKLSAHGGGEIISADSRQVYRGLDIGSGKVHLSSCSPNSFSYNCDTSCGRAKCHKKLLCYKNILHHLLDIASPKRTFTVSQYQKLAKKTLADILRRGKIPIICGGTGLYIDSIIYNTKFPEIPPQPKLRKKLEKLATEKLFEKLQKLDPRRAENIDKHNRRRLMRALEIVITTKKPVPNTALINESKTQNYQVLKIGIKKSPDELKKLIAKRLKKRLKQGMIEEVKKLHRNPPIGGGLSWQRLDNLGLEYRYVSRYLRGLISKEEMIESIQKESEKYAKRQMTWFKKDKNIIWINAPQKAFLIIRDQLGL